MAKISKIIEEHKKLEKEKPALARAITYKTGYLKALDDVEEINHQKIASCIVSKPYPKKNVPKHLWEHACDFALALFGDERKKIKELRG